MACASVCLRVWWKPRKALSAFSVTPHLILLRSGLSLNIEVAFSFQPAGSQQAFLFPFPTGWGCSAILRVLGDELRPSLFTAESSSQTGLLSADFSEDLPTILCLGVG